MSWTQFKLIEFGQRTTPKVNGIPAALGVWYLNTDVLSIEKNDPTHYGEPFDYLKYKVTDGTIESNNANLVINCPPDLLVSATSSNQSITALENTLYNVVDYIPFSAGVDRIKIISFDNIGQLKISNFSIYPNYTVMHYDFANLNFKTEFGTGVPYQKIYYQVGNINGFNATVYELTFNINGLASLDPISESNGTEINMPDSPDIRYFEAAFQINTARINGVANVEININLSASAWPVSTENTLILDYGSDNIERQANGIENISVNLDSNGSEDFLLQMGFDTADLPITGTVTFTLIDINGDTILVDAGNDTIIYNINF